MNRLTATLFATVVIFTLSSTFVFAQYPTAYAPAQSSTGITIGIKGGGNRSDFYGDDVEADDWDPSLGFCVGGFLNLKIDEMISIQPEAFFTMKGAQAEEFGETFKISLAYLEIPVLAKISIPNPGGIEPCLLIGPAFAMNMSATAKYDYVYESEEEDIADEVQDFDLGFVIGAGLDIDHGQGQGKLSIEIRYTLGLKVVPDEEGEEDFDLKNSVISLMAGLSF